MREIPVATIFGTNNPRAVLSVATGLARIASRTANVPKNAMACIIWPLGNEAVLWLIFPMVVLMAPLVEEVLFRGVIYRVLAQALGARWGIVLSGLIFGLVHMNLAGLIPAPGQQHGQEQRAQGEARRQAD